MSHSFRISVIRAASALLLAWCNPALALDFHPLTSQDLSAGLYEFDNIFIPADVTLTMAGTPGEATFRALGVLSLLGSLVAPGWRLNLEAGGTLSVQGTILVAGGAVSLTSLNGSGDLTTPGRLPNPRPGGSLIICASDTCTEDVTLQVGGDLDLRGGNGIRLGAPSWPLSPIPEPETWALLLTGFGLVVAVVRRKRNLRGKCSSNRLLTD